MTEPVVIQRLFILKETIEEEYLERGIKVEQEPKSGEQWGKRYLCTTYHLLVISWTHKT